MTCSLETHLKIAVQSMLQGLYRNETECNSKALYAVGMGMTVP